MRYNFEWDPKKADSNLKKHKIDFERATSIFRDPNILSIPDKDHSENEERWISLGFDETGILLVISHTFKSINSTTFNIRIISARKAIKREIEQYEEGI